MRMISIENVLHGGNMSSFKEQVEECTECGECNLVCPVCAVDDRVIFGPEHKIKLLAKIEANGQLSQEEIDSIYLCTRCGVCNDVCPVDIDIYNIVQYERSLLAKQGREPDKTKHITNNILTKYNPKGLDNEERESMWVTDDLEFSDDSSLGYMAGCWVAFKNPHIAQDTVRLLNTSGVKPRLIPDERCCGLFVIDNGHLEEARDYAKSYTDYLESLGIKRLLVSCPSCYNVLNNLYPGLYRKPKYEVVHAIAYFKELYDAGKLDFNNMGEKVMIKDACPMKDHYDMARELLDAAGYSVFDPFDKKGFCCGAPAGVKPNYPEISNAIGKYSLDKRGDATSVVTYCPFCMHHFDGVREAYDIETPIEDIASLLWRAMKK
ncbi:(Fe-S)-binding protein [archaeon]|nr:MAG: (Fe-S)-binding protein [archaeon]